MHLQVVFQNSLSSSSVEAEIAIFSNAIILLGTKPLVISFAAMGVVEKNKLEFLPLKDELPLSAIILLSFSLSVSYMSILEQGHSDCICVALGRTSAAFLPLGTIVI